MKFDSLRFQAIEQITQQLMDIHAESAIDTHPGMKDQIIELISRLRCAMYPHIFTRAGHDISSPMAAGYNLQRASELLDQLFEVVRPGDADNSADVTRFLQAMPSVKACLETDVQAAYEGDPAAKNTEEIMLAYPAFEAISIHRIAHELYRMQIPLLPRMMSEYAHQITGIDIHPGASIGRYFFIDHGTGVVIGETTTIGDHVKLYQGVTLGAKSFELDENGNPVKGIKRHPDLGSHVIVYAGATILGGSTRIGDHCVIGGNVWLTHSVESGRTIMAAQEQQLKII